MADRLPPGPRLPAWAQGVLVGSVPLGYVRWCHRRYGNAITLRMPRVGPYVYLADPEAVRTVFRGNPATYHAGEANGILLADLLGASSVLVTDEDQHQRQRRLMSPPFHGQAVRRQEALMSEVAAAEVDRWPVGEPFAVLTRMRAVTLEVILRTVVGVHDEQRLAVLRRVLPPVVEVGAFDLMQFVFPALQGRWPWRRFREAAARADVALREEIAACRAAPDLERRPDVLATLVRTVADDGAALHDEELRDQLMTLLIAGHETTATALGWAFERLVRHPDVLEQAQRAALDGDDGYLDAVAVETLRVRPVVVDVARRVTQPVEIAGWRLPAGTIVAPAIALIQTSGGAYENPMRFDPSRWVERRPDPSIWLPFGGGDRRCLGAAFAQLELRSVLREVLRRMTLEPTGARDERARVRHVTMVPHAGARITVRSRNPAAARASAA